MHFHVQRRGTHSPGSRALHRRPLALSCLEMAQCVDFPSTQLKQWGHLLGFRFSGTFQSGFWESLKYLKWIEMVHSEWQQFKPRINNPPVV